MSLVEGPTSVDCVHQRSGTTTTSTTAIATTAAVTDHCHHHHLYHHHHHRLSPKRKFDEYDHIFDEDEEYVDFSDSVSIRMRKVEPNAVDFSSTREGEGTSNHLDSRVSDARSASFSCSTRPEWTRSPSRLQFFIRMISEGNTLVIHAQASDTVKSLHERIQTITGIPIFEQRLIYRGKQLQWEQSLAECSIQNDAGLQLVGRLRSTEHPQAWQIVDDIVSMVCRLCRGEMIPSALKTIQGRMTEYLHLATTDVDLASGKLQIFMSSHAPAALVMLYFSGIEGNKDYADSAIKHFLSSIRNSVPKLVHNHCAPIVLEFCKLLRSASNDDPLYMCCRSTLGYVLETVGVSRRLKNTENGGGLVMVQEILPFVSELGKKLSSDLLSSMQSPTSIGPLVSDVCDFTAFVLPLRTTILEQVGVRCPVSDPYKEGSYKHPLFGEELDFLSHIFLDLLKKMDDCLHKMEANLVDRGKGAGDIFPTGWSQYLAILKELNSISELYEDGDGKLWSVMRVRKASLCSLIIRFSKRADDHGWILEHKDMIDFESRRHLVMMMFPEVKEDYEELHEMLIDRSHLLSESFEYIAHAEPNSLHAGLFMEFKNEEATGPGVLREWFFLVCQAIFNPQNALFVPCPNDRRRFFPNPASKVDPLHLEYFTFSGRVIALALMHKVQVGVVFDRVFFLQLAGRHISLEDTRDADPCLYRSCKKILEMDADFIDSDALGLTFVTEVEELGSRKVVELLQGGKSIIVNRKNRKEYVELLIQHRFVTSISEQVSHFAQGFADILRNSKQQKFFFQSLEVEDFDWMLHGSESAICVGDWKAHTEYCGFKETDPQILWFWKIVGEMSAEQRKVLLFFWTSVKYLPVEGFRGLASRLSIYKTVEPYDHLPSSHTCFYRLCFPPYPSMAVMKDRLQIITQEHVGCSFGTW